MLGWLPEDVSPYGAGIDALFYFIYYLTAAAFIIVTALMLIFLYVYRDQGGRRAAYTHGNTAMEIIWTVIPAIVFISLGLVSRSLWEEIKLEPPETDTVVKVTGKQFNWEILYPGPDGEFDTADDKQIDNDIRVPAGKPIRVILASKDVIHSFFMPNLRFKQDMVPGREIIGWFQANKPGRYEIPCAELCGFGHSGMKGWLYALAPEEYQAWRDEQWPQTASSDETEATAQAETTPPQESAPAQAAATEGESEGAQGVAAAGAAATTVGAAALAETSEATQAVAETAQEAVTQATTAATEASETAVSAAQETVSEIAEGAVEDVQGTAADTALETQGSIESATEATQDAAERAQDLATQATTDTAQEAGTDAVTEVAQETIQDQDATATETVQGVTEGVQGTAAEAAKDAAETVQETSDAAQQASEGAQEATEAEKEATDAAIEAPAESVEGAAQETTNAVQGTSDATQGTADGITDSTTETAQEALKGASSAFPKEAERAGAAAVAATSGTPSIVVAASTTAQMPETGTSKTQAAQETSAEQSSSETTVQGSSADISSRQYAFTPTASGQPDQSASCKGQLEILSGATIYDIAGAFYTEGKRFLGVDLIRDYNTHIENLDDIYPGQKLCIPTLEQTTRLRQEQESGYFNLILDAFRSTRKAQALARSVQRKGYQAVVIPRQVSNSLLLQRVEITGLQDQTTASQAWKLFSSDDLS